MIRCCVLLFCALGVASLIGCSGSSNPLNNTDVVDAKGPAPQIEFVTPQHDGDPVASPVVSGADGQNEFNYDNSLPGVLTIDLVALVKPTGTASKIKADCYFTVQPIGKDAGTWGTANPGGQPTVSGDCLLATVTFTTLPTDNSHFGLKLAAIYYKGSTGVIKCDEAKYEVFFLKDEKNNPSAAMSIGAGIPEQAMPNWLYYWGICSAAGDPNCAYMYPTHPQNTPGTVGAVFRSNLPSLYFADLARLANTRTGHKGIDCFAEVVIHERLHRTHYNEIIAGAPDTDMDNLKDADEVGGDLDLNGAVDTEDTNLNGKLDSGEDIGLDRKVLSGPEFIASQPEKVVKYGAGNGGLPDSETGTAGTSKYHANSLGGRFDDEDDLCYTEENKWTVGSADGYDWAKPGKQHKDKY